MNTLNKEVLHNSISLYNYLSIYGNDKYNVKEDLLLLKSLDKLIKYNFETGILKQCDFDMLVRRIYQILQSNEFLKYCKVDVSDDNTITIEVLLSEDLKYGFISEKKEYWLVREYYNPDEEDIIIIERAIFSEDNYNTIVVSEDEVHISLED